MTTAERQQFQTILQQYYQAHGRHDLPWRLPERDGSFDAYKILVSELMLQQTQVPRVIPKFHEFMMSFPTLQALASAPLGDVLRTWSGLGYNRRAKYLWQAAQATVQDYDGVFPRTVAGLVTLPGVGPNTAGAILAYAFNEPTVFVETNIRTVYIHHFFAGQTAVSDAAIRQLVTDTLDTTDPRSFYWSLMDYGTYLKQAHGNLAQASKHYTRQSVFKGSRRQVRGAVIRLLAEASLTEGQLAQHIPDDRLPAVLQDLLAEQMISRAGPKYRLK